MSTAEDLKQSESEEKMLRCKDKGDQVGWMAKSLSNQAGGSGGTLPTPRSSQPGPPGPVKLTNMSPAQELKQSESGEKMLRGKYKGNQVGWMAESLGNQAGGSGGTLPTPRSSQPGPPGPVKPSNMSPTEDLKQQLKSEEEVLRCKDKGNQVGWMAKSLGNQAGGSGGTLPTPRSSQPGPPGPVKLSTMSPAEDLKQLKSEEEMLLYGVRKANKNLVYSDLEETRDEVIVYGDIELSEEEIDLLNLVPGFMVTKALSKEEIRVEFNVAVTKIRWNRRTRGVEGMAEEDVVKDEKDAIEAGENIEEQEYLAEVLEQEAMDVINENGNSFCMGKLRATSINNNRRVFMSGPSSPKVEAGLNTRMYIWQRVHDQHMEKECNNKGEQLKSNLTITQQLALKSLGKKVSKVEIVILEYDKGKRFVVVP